jgi:delta-aminolevulinic acid dehydratase/porphobilinogen synthase
MDAYEKYKEAWRIKTYKQIANELESMRKYVKKFSQSSSWHGKDMVPPGSMADGDKITALRELLIEKVVA